MFESGSVNHGEKEHKAASGVSYSVSPIQVLVTAVCLFCENSASATLVIYMFYAK